MPELNLFELEKDLINPTWWDLYTEKMPQECLDVIGNNEGEGIGWNEEQGWFILCSCGQGPILVWMEK